MDVIETLKGKTCLQKTALLQRTEERMRNISRTLTVLCMILPALFLAIPALAQQTLQKNGLPFAVEETIFWGEQAEIISATRYVKRLGQAPAIATVINAQEIRNMGARDIRDVLKRIPGIGVSLSTGYGLYGIESRGIKSVNSEKVLLLIDGHRVNETATGGAAHVFDDLMVENVERIEIIRGPGSALYGANAFVAVINVVTKTADKINGIEVRDGFGSFDTFHNSIMFGGEKSGVTITGTVDHINAKSSQLHIEQDAIGQSGRTDDWKEKTDFGLNLMYGGLSITSRYVNKKRGSYLGVVNVLNDESYVESSHLLEEISYRHSFGENLHLLLKEYYDEWRLRLHWELLPESSALPDGLIGIPEVKNRTLGSELQVDYSLLDKHTFTVGGLYENIEQYDVRTNANFDPRTDPSDPPVLLPSLQDITSWGNFNRNKDRYISAFYAQWVWEIMEGMESTIGLRRDQYSSDWETYNPRVGLVWNFVEKGNIKLLYGSAFRAPNFTELYNANNPAERGNPDTRPEKIRTYEASIGYRFTKNHSANLTYFNSEIEDIIGIQGITFGNLGKAKVSGIETEFRAHYDNDTYGYINYSYLTPWDVDAAEKIADVASQKGNIGINAGITRYINVNANLLVIGERSRKSTDTRGELAGYEVVDLTLIFKRFYNSAEIRASVYNLLDERYSDPAPVGTVPGDYPRNGTNFVLEGRYRF